MNKLKVKLVLLLMIVLLVSGWMTHEANAVIAGHVTVAKSGGDYTSINAALAAISPSAANPYIIEVMPGTYTEDIQISSSKSYITLRGAGRDVTILRPGFSGDTVINVVTGLQNVSITGFTISGATGGASGGIVLNSPINVSDNSLTGNNYGIYSLSGSTGASVTGNWIYSNSYGMYNTSVGNMLIQGNKIFSNTIDGILNNACQNLLKILDNTFEGGQIGIYNNNSSPTITGNTITGSTSVGIVNTNGSSPQIITNYVTANSGGTDITVDSTSAPNVSHNIYSTLTGTTAVGHYNVRPGGSIIN